MDPNLILHGGRIRQQEMLEAAKRRQYAVPPWEYLIPPVRFVYTRLRNVVLFIRQQAAASTAEQRSLDLENRRKRLQQPVSRR